jgi:hypothetical protein
MKKIVVFAAAGMLATATIVYAKGNDKKRSKGKKIKV